MHFPFLGCCFWEIFFSSPPMNIILNHTATESFKALLKSQLLKKQSLILPRIIWNKNRPVGSND